MPSIFASGAADMLAAFSRSQAIIEFDPSGTILSANDNFCRAMGYDRSRIVGQNHRMFVDPAYAQSAAYKDFWARLAAGECISDEFRRIGEGGREVWIQASYNAVRKGSGGKVYKVVKIASDVTAAKMASLENSGKIEAISRAQAVIEFTVDGRILGANANFLATLGYALEEIVGQHHRMFVAAEESRSQAYEEFWARLRGGEFVASEFKRIGKGGREVWIQASYNPIFAPDGTVVKVVKFATDVTERVAAVERLGKALAGLAEGDLAQRIDTRFVAALEPLRESFNASVETLRGAMGTIRENAGAMATGANQIRMAADDLARRTEQQAAALEETSAAIGELTVGVSDSSKRAEDAGALVARTKDDAEQSGVVVGKAVDAMKAIETSSEKVGKIIGVIDEIAFQTNLLALNAGVEAARAGEAGRGFAVVAQEVRGLAQRSAEAAKEIKDLISTSASQVATGVKLVGETGSALQLIVERIVEVNRHVASIVETSRGQAVGLSEINVAIGTLDQGTQQNAAMVEESTAASNELAQEAATLNGLLEQFRTGAEPGATSPVHAMRGNVVKAFANAGRR